MLGCRIECWKMRVGPVCAAWGWLLLFPLACIASTNNRTQNHTCHRTETVEVRVAVPMQEPATFRSYTWCLKVPPRCSKYTVVMRERITYETEVRNHTVSECCAGYVSLYGECVPACPSCVNMRCDAARNCTCNPGYLGTHCNETCPAGKWGDRCLEACVCRVGEDCDSVSGRCSLSTSTVPPPTTSTLPPPTTVLPSSPPTAITSPISPPTTQLPPTTLSSPQTKKPAMTTSPPTRFTPTTPNSFVNLTLTDPTTSAEDLTDFNIILRPRSNDSVRLVGNNNDVNSLNALGDLDYPVLPTDSAVEFNYIQDHQPTKNLVSNLSVNSSVMNAQWISELGTHSGVTLGSTLGLLALVVVTVSAIVRCRRSKAEEHSVAPPEKNSLHLITRNSHYAVPGPPSFSFINGYALDLSRDVNEDTYDQPRSVRCLVANEPVYDELRY